MAVALLQDGQHIKFPLGLRGQRDVPALARQRHAVAGTRWKHQARHAEPRARPHQRNGAARHGRTAAHLAQLRGGQRGQGQRQRGEVVDDHQALQAQRRLERALRETPAVVGHAHFIARDRVGNAKGSLTRGGDVHLGQIGGNGRVYRGELGAGQHAGVVQGPSGWSCQARRMLVPPMSASRRRGHAVL